MKNILLFLSVLAIYVLIYTLNYYYPLQADDFSYSFVFNGQKRVENISDIITSQLNHYKIWGGRTIVHIIAQFLLMIDLRISCLLNALAYAGLVYVMCKISIVSIKLKVYISILLLLFIHVLVWFAQPEFCTTVLWKTGSANYLWGSLLVILFMYPYYKYLNSQLYKDNEVRIILFLLCGIVAGWTNENLGIALIIFITSIMIMCKFNKKNTPKWSIAGLIGVIIGYSIMIIAPGNYKRSHMIVAEYHKQGMADSDITRHVLDLASNYFYSYILPLLIIWMIALAMYLFTNTGYTNQDKKKTMLNSLLFLIPGFISFFVMLMSPIFPLRALFGTIILIIIAIGILFSGIRVNSNAKYAKVINIVCIVFMICIFSYDYARKYKTIKEIHDSWESRTTYLGNQKRMGVRDIVFTEKLKQFPSMYGFSDLTSDPHSWWNTDYAKYYGVDSATVIGIDQK